MEQREQRVSSLTLCRVVTEEDVVKEGWLNDWTPQITIGSDDISSHTWESPENQFAIEDMRSNGFNNRYYVAATKHVHIPKVGELGAHVAWLYNVRSDYSLNAPSFGLFGHRKC